MRIHRPYGESDIARYVLGLDMREQAADIQSLLAHDDAAAAKALKWETYLLDIVDALPAAEPSPEILIRIRATLGMLPTDEEATQIPGADGAPVATDPSPAAGDRPAGDDATQGARRGKLRLVVAIVALIAAGLLALLVFAGMHETDPQPTQQIIQLD